jgi:hypothetical protein
MVTPKNMNFCRSEIILFNRVINNTKSQARHLHEPADKVIAVCFAEVSRKFNVVLQSRVPVCSQSVDRRYQESGKHFVITVSSRKTGKSSQLLIQVESVTFLGIHGTN